MDSVTTPVESNQEAAREFEFKEVVPALQALCGIGERERGLAAVDIINALANGYASVLTQLLGHKATVGLLRSHADHLEKHPPEAQA